jgi:transcriptional regulator with XRE-family HTH domain
MARPTKENAPKRKPTILGDNIRRLLGVHALTAAEGAALIGISPQGLSELLWRERPSLESLERLESFFEVDLSDLLRTPFVELLEVEVADRQRFRRVEAKIRKHRASHR